MKSIIFVSLSIIILSLILTGCTVNNNRSGSDSADIMKAEQSKIPDLKGADTAVFAGGCFWCMESGFESQPGVIEVISGYTGGDTKNPTYEEVTSGKTGHYEAVKVYYDPERISYEQLLEGFWIQIDPTDAGGQFADRGSQYKTAIFYKNGEEKAMAEVSKKDIAKHFDKPIVTEILEFKEFYPAEEYHQDYYLKQQTRYKTYETLSGRKAFVDGNKEKMAKETDDFEDVIEDLDPLQYKVTQEEGTEPPFDNKYWDNHEDGIYVDVVSGEPLFSSTDKFDSGTGWPSFTKPLVPENIANRTDNKLLATRTEVKSKMADSHLGHVFRDGPDPTGIRYCINSAALRFIPKDDLKDEGYEEYMYLFETEE